MKTPTAEDLMNEVLLNIDHSSLKEAHYTAIKEAMIEFAKLHICDCKLQILEELPDTLSTEVYDIVRNTYLLKNIK